jgi:DNA-binding response OmpR family regulator
MRVLIIEDSPEIVESVTLCFKMFIPEAVVSYSYDGLQGIELVKTNPFAIVILDLNLPDMDGLEVLRQVRSFSDVPVIILTVREKLEDKLKSMTLGANDYIIKPFKPRELIASVTNATSLKSNFHEKK